MIEVYLILLLVGITAGTIGSMVGLGGGVIIVPVLVFLHKVYDGFQITPQIAVGTSLLVVAVSSLSSSRAYYKQKKVDTRSALLFIAGSGPGSIVGATISTQLTGSGFLIGFGSFMIVMSFIMLLGGKMKKGKLRWSVTRTYKDQLSGEELQYGYTYTLAISASFIVGLLAGMFGVGGGALMMPVMLLLFHFPVHLAAATSMFMIFLSSMIGSGMHALYGNIAWSFAAVLAPGAWIGGKLGAWLSLKLKSRTLVLALRIMLILTGTQLIWNGIQA